MTRAKQFTHELTKERLAKMHALPASSPMKSPQPHHPLPELAWGQGITHYADHYFIQETLRNMELQDQPPRPGIPVHKGCDVTPETDQYDSPDPDNQEDDLTSQSDLNSEEEYTDATGHSGRSLPAEHNCRRNHTMHRERAHAKHNFHPGVSTHGRKLAFSLFRETNRDDCISYHDWCAEIEAALAKSYEPEHVKTAMFEAMEGMAKDHAANIDQYGVLTALEILEELDRLYSMSMTFQSLNAALCGLHQRATESCRDYYDCLTQITVLLWERHASCFCPGLWAGHRSMVVHLKDHPTSTPLDLLAALMENEQNDILANACYPAATSSKMSGGSCHSDHPQSGCQMGKQDRYTDRKAGGYAVRQMQLG